MEWKSSFEINIDIPDIDSEFNDRTIDIFDDPQTRDWLLKLQNEILLNYKLTPEEQKIINSIDNSDVFQPTETLKNYIEKRKWLEAIDEVFKILWRLISSKNEIWFNEFDDIDINSLNLDEKNEEELIWFMNFIEWKIDSTVDIKKDLKFTYLLSAVKNKLLEKKSIVDKEEQLKNNLAVWDVVLLNKQLRWKDIWTRLLEAYDDNYDTDFWHAAIVISTDPIRIRHSTTENLRKSDREWFVEEAELDWYLDKCGCSWYDLLALRPSEDIKNKILAFSEQNIWKSYDSNAAICWWLYWKDWEWEKVISWFWENNGEKDDSFNCVEIIAQALDQEKLKDITHPNEFLEYMDIFKPVYLTTIRRS